MTTLRIAALGYYGFGNLGDEAVLAGIRRALDSEPATRNARFLALSNDPEDTRRLHPGAEAADRWKMGVALDALKGTDLFILGGGSLLQDATSARSVLWYAIMASLARRRARRVLWWGQGIGPLHSPLSRFLVRFIANQADILTVRDESSEKLLKDVGAKGSIEVVADPAFALEPHSPPSSTHARTLLSLRAWKSDDLGAALANGGLPDELRGPRGKDSPDVLAIPMHLPDDADYMARTPGDAVQQFRWRESSGVGVETVLGYFARAELVVAMRLHALIFAARCATPFVALSYDPKVDALARAAGQEDALLPVNGITREALGETARRVRETADARRAALTVFAAAQQERARIPARRAAQVL